MVVPKVQDCRKQFKKPNVVCCFCCGAPGHRVAECKYRDKTCHTCGKKGHLAKVCKSSVTRQPGNQKRQNLRHKQIRQVEDDASGESSDSLGDVLVLKQTGSKLPPLRVSLQLDDCKITMEVDTGASVSIMSEDTYRKIWPKKTSRV